jgi:hypothetical protein
MQNLFEEREKEKQTAAQISQKKLYQARQGRLWRVLTALYYVKSAQIASQRIF